MTAINAALIATVSTQTLSGYSVATLAITSAATEYNYTLPNGTKAFAIQNRNDGSIYLRSVSGGDYWTFRPGQPWFPVNIKGDAVITIILSSNKPSQTVEILAWS